MAQVGIITSASCPIQSVYDVNPEGLQPSGLMSWLYWE